MIFDARGHFTEPHTGREVPLGTLEVRQYLRDGKVLDAPMVGRGLFPTHGPGNRFQAVLFIENEGFLSLFHRVRLADRYDLAIMSTKGMSVVAARHLVDEVCGGHKIPLLILHDFDKAGFSILGTLRRNNRRYTYSRKVEVIDLGLRLEVVEAWGLESEAVHIKNSSEVRSNLKENGATKEEVEFLLSGRRVELNSFLSRPLINWVEDGLKKQGIKKVLPDTDVLQEAYISAFVRAFVQAKIPELKRQAQLALKDSEFPVDIRARVKALIKKEPESPWDHGVMRLARKAVRELREERDGDSDGAPDGGDSAR